MHLNQCMLCKSPSFHTVQDFGMTPLANCYPTDNKLPPTTYPLKLVICDQCKHLQLDYLVPDSILYAINYAYASNTSKSNRKHFKTLSDTIVDSFRPRFVVDVASNDGTFLSNFTCKTLGVDPADIPSSVNKIKAFFHTDTAKEIINTHGKADVITMLNVFAHNSDLSELLKASHLLLRDNGVLIIEVAYAMAMLETSSFDLIYHEHKHSHHLLPLLPFFAENNMRIFHAEVIQTHGGSLRIYASKKSDNVTPHETVNALCLQEIEQFDKLVETFPTKIAKVKADIIDQLRKAADLTVGVLGFPAKATTFIAHTNIAPYITHVFDDNPLKIGRWTPNEKWKIHSTDDIKTIKPEYLLILSWNYATELRKRFKQSGAKFITTI